MLYLGNFLSTGSGKEVMKKIRQVFNALRLDREKLTSCSLDKFEKLSDKSW